MIMTDPERGTVSVGDQARTLPLYEARDLFLALGAARRSGVGVAIDQSTMIAPGQAETITFTADGAFIDEYDIPAFLRSQKRR